MSPNTGSRDSSRPVVVDKSMFGNPFDTLGLVSKELNQAIKSASSLPAQARRPNRNEPRRHHQSERLERTPVHLRVAGYVSYLVLFVLGYAREFLFGTGPLGRKVRRIVENNRHGYAKLYGGFESFYIRNVYRRLKDVFNRPISSVPGAEVSLAHRHSDDHFWTWKMDEARPGPKDCINLASYNYLGFAENTGPCTSQSINAVRSNGLSPCSVRQELGTMSIHRELEMTVAKFLGVEDTITVGMGFATNALNLPRLLDRKTLVLSDERNHASLILGLRLSKAIVRVFRHNDIEHLEQKLREGILSGQPRTRRPFNKIVVVVEGVYSMEGTIVKLPEIVALKKKYGCYIYLDEAHSVGAMGPNGRGVVDYYGLDPKDIDIMMGTFSKSFGAAGGYIGGSLRLIRYLRVNSQANVYATAMSPPVARQIIASMNLIMAGKGDGMERLKRLARNSRYFRRRLQQMGCIVYGHDDSPVVPLMLFLPAKIPALVNGLLELGIASVGVGFPATDMTEERARFCVSAGHTKDMLDKALDAIDRVAERIHVKYSKRNVYSEKDIVY